MSNIYYYSDGTISNYRDYDKILHRENGPAIERKYGESWYLNGKKHRINGPAVTYMNGKDKEYWIEGKIVKFYNEV